MQYQRTEYTFKRLHDKNEALRTILLLLIQDKAYQFLPLRQVATFDQSVLHDNYILMIQGDKAVGLISWIEISETVKDDCLKMDRSPLLNEIQTVGDAIYCTATTAIDAKLLYPMWKYFAKLQAHRDVLVKRHFKAGKDVSHPIMLIKNCRVVSH